VIRGSGRLTAPVDLTTRAYEIRYEEGWKPSALSIDATLRGQNISIVTAVSGTSATSTVTQQGTPASKTDTIAPDAVLLPNSVYGAYEALAARLATREPGAEIPVYVAPQAQITVTLKLVEAHTIQLPQQQIRGRRYRLSMANPGVPLDVELVTDEAHRVLRVGIPAAGLEVAREDVASVAARQLTVGRPNDEDVRIPGNGFTLAGTVSRPAEVVPDQRLPAVVLIGGSGPHDRDANVFGIPIFGQLASALADAGFLVVRYDKRGVGQSGGRVETAALADYAEDALSVVRYVRKRKDVDSDRVSLVGHSEGAWIALLAGARERDIASLVLIAGGGTTGAQLVLEQQQRALEQMKLPDAERQQKVELQERIQAAVLGKGTWDGIPDDLRRQADTAWFRSFLEFDPGVALARTRQPILIVQPELDRQVPPHHSEKLADATRARKHAAPVEVVRIPGANHLLVSATTGEVSEYSSLESRTIRPEVAEAIAAWLRK
jgi:pimeloyl-ACP methyl ester carboxylesterase